MMKGRKFIPWLALVVAIGGLGIVCGRGARGWPRLVQSPSIPPLGSEIEGALAGIRAGRAALPRAETRASEALDEAEEALSRVEALYLPLIEGTRRAYNAHQFAALGETTRALRELDHIETILETVAEAGDQEVAQELEEPLQLVTAGRAALISASPEVPHHLKGLAERLELILLKGEMILRQKAARPPGGA